MIKWKLGRADKNQKFRGKQDIEEWRENAKLELNWRIGRIKEIGEWGNVGILADPCLNLKAILAEKSKNVTNFTESNVSFDNTD